MTVTLLRFMLALVRGLTSQGGESRKMEPPSDTHLEDEPRKKRRTTLEKLEFFNM